jgi:hypothetical protein
MQTRKQSLVEAVFNILIGYGIAIAAQVTIFPLFGFSAPLSSNLEIGAIFTVVSLARSYMVRRFFNWIHHKG